MNYLLYSKLRDLSATQPFSTAVEIVHEIHEKSESRKEFLQLEHTLTLCCSALLKLCMDPNTGCVTHSHPICTITKYPGLTIFVLLLQ